MDISSLLEESCRQAHLLDPKRQITEEFPSEMMIMRDHDAIKQVLLIIVDNALKHSIGEIKLTARPSGAWCEIRVQDFGEGITPEKLEHVFDRFYRGEDATIPGYGLGLPIAKALMEGQGGEISMESELGHGSTVTLRLPTRAEILSVS